MSAPQRESQSADGKPVLRKRPNETSQPESSSSRQVARDCKRARRDNTENYPKGGRETEGDEWEQLYKKLKDVESGRADSELEEWEKGWMELCDRMGEQARLKGNEKETMKEIGSLLRRCAFQECRLGMRE